MKFMKLGSKPDIFTVRGNITSVVSDLSSDITFDVDGHKFHLHKFPLLAKWGCLNKLIASALESASEEVLIYDFPGGVECFEMCAKYCYGITITLSPHNVGEVRCGAEFLQMTEATEKSNMIYKLEVFLNSSILRGWKDAIICLRSSKPYMPWCEDLKIMGRCIESIASKTCVNPAEVTWSFTNSRPLTSSTPRQASCTERSSSHRMAPVPADWWVEDLSDLDIDLYKRVILAIKSKGVAQELVAESIRIYTLKNIPALLHITIHFKKEYREKKKRNSKNLLAACNVFLQTGIRWMDRLPFMNGNNRCIQLLVIPFNSAVCVMLHSDTKVVDSCMIPQRRANYEHICCPH